MQVSYTFNISTDHTGRSETHLTCKYECVSAFAESHPVRLKLYNLQLLCNFKLSQEEENITEKPSSKTTW